MQTAPAEPNTRVSGEAARGSLTLPIAASVFSTGFGLAVLVTRSAYFWALRYLE